jgi:hypothetical protein
MLDFGDTVKETGGVFAAVLLCYDPADSGRFLHVRLKNI